MFKLIISPEFGERLALTQLVRNLMQRMERDLGCQLEWIAVNHFNTEHPHAHIALRGVAQGQELRLDRDYVKHGIRRHAEDLCTEKLGFRTHADAIEAERREIDQPRLTSLDRQIARHNQGPPEQSFRTEVDGRRRPSLVKRLAVLQKMGLAEQTGTKHWDVRSDFEAALRTMQTVTDRQRMVAAHAQLLSDPSLPIHYTPPATIKRLEGRVIGHAMDERTGKAHLILESVEGDAHIIPHSVRMEHERSQGRLAPGHFVRLTSRGNSKRGLSIADEGDAEAYLLSMRGSRRPGPVRRFDLPPMHGGWLGRYRAAVSSEPFDAVTRTLPSGERSRR